MRYYSRIIIVVISFLIGSPIDFIYSFPSHVLAANHLRQPVLIKQKPKNIIFMIGDGMGIGQLEIARLLERGKEGRLFLQTLPRTGLVMTYSANNFVTDSAAAATALATGMKTNNGSIGIGPDGKEVNSILDLFKKDGKKTGVISTNTVTDATPAAFTASVPNRWSDQSEIARQQFANKVDVLLGGGANLFLPNFQQGLDLLNAFRSAGYSIASNRDQLMSETGDRLLGLFHPSYMTYKQDREELGSKEPLLVDMTEKAIDTLSKGNKGFFVMVEGARIDHAAHAGDIAGIWKETVEFDKAVQYATRWAQKHGDTLVVVTADHETMGISAPEAVNYLAYRNLKVTPEYMATKLFFDAGKGMYTIDSIQGVFKEYAGVELSVSEAQVLNERIHASSGQVYASKRIEWEIGSMIAEKYNAPMLSSKIRRLGTTGGHTANMVPIFSYGSGSELFQGVMNNTDIPRKMAELMGYTFQ